MSKVLPFSQTFPSYHPRKWQRTYFVEKFLTSIKIDYTKADYFFLLVKLNPDLSEDVLRDFWEGLSRDEFLPKGHTCRAGHEVNVGDIRSPRVWGNDVNPKSKRSGPYHSKQIIIAPDIQVKKVWDFEILNNLFFIDGESYNIGHSHLLNKLAANDGLSVCDLLDWFKWPKDSGKMQIICWDKTINY